MVYTGGKKDTKLYVGGLPDITVRPWEIEDSTHTMDSDEEVEYHTSRYCRCRNPCYSTRSTYRRISISALCK